jgi:hypothetical protein
MMNIFEQVIEIERNGRRWKLSAFRRYDPGTLLTLKGAMTLFAVGTGVQIASTLQQGKNAETIANARAEVDEKNAEAVRVASVEEAKIQGEKGRRFRASQKVAGAASNIRINVGSPLVIEAETRANIAKEIGFGLEAGRIESEGLINTAKFERAIGKAKRKQSKFDALSQGIQGAASIAFMGSKLPKTPKGFVPGTGGLAKIPTFDRLATGGVPFR